MAPPRTFDEYDIIIAGGELHSSTIPSPWTRIQAHRSCRWHRRWRDLWQTGGGGPDVTHPHARDGADDQGRSRAHTAGPFLVSSQARLEDSQASRRKAERLP